MLFSSTDKRTQLFFSRAIPEEPEVPVTPMVATWLPIGLIKVEGISGLVVSWEVDPPDSAGWSIALLEAHDYDMQNRNVVARRECDPPVGGKITVTLPTAGALGLTYWNLMLYHRSSNFDVHVNNVTVEVVNEKQREAEPIH